MSTPPPVPFEAQGHRGARGLCAENTLPGFARALEVGVHAVELDVGLTADGAVVLHHDQVVSPVICRDTAPADAADPLFPYVGRRIRDLTLAQLRTLDAGAGAGAGGGGSAGPGPGPGPARAESARPAPPHQVIPMATLPEVCALVTDYRADEVRLCVELKTSPSWSEDEVTELAVAVVAILDRYGLTARSRLLGFDWRVLDAAARLAPTAGRVALVEDATRTADWLGGRQLSDFGSDLARAAADAGATMVSPETPLLTGDLLESAHARGLPVVVWTVNDPAEMRRCVEIGVDAVVTDFPDRLRTVMAAYGLPLPLAHPRPEPAGR